MDKKRYATQRVDGWTANALRELSEKYGISQIDAAAKAVELLKVQAEKEGKITVEYKKRKGSSND